MSRRLGAVVAALLGAVCVATVLLPVPEWIDALVFIPLVTGLTGYGLTRVLVPGTGPAEKSVYAFALAVSTAALGGLLLQIFVDLDRAAWAVLMITVATSTLVVALGRTGDTKGGLQSGERPVPRTERARRPGTIAALGLIAAAGVAGVSIAIAVHGAEAARDQTRFATLWSVRSDDTWTLGVENHGDRPVSYELRIVRAARSLDSWTVPLAAHSAWSVDFALPATAGSKPVTAELYRDGRRYRSVTLETAAQG